MKGIAAHMLITSKIIEETPNVTNMMPPDALIGIFKEKSNQLKKVDANLELIAKNAMAGWNSAIIHQSTV